MVMVNKDLNQITFPNEPSNIHGKGKAIVITDS